MAGPASVNGLRFSGRWSRLWATVNFLRLNLDVCSGVLINQLFCSGEQSNLAHYSLSAKPWETL
jgi:hypothetical protein